MPVLRHFFYSIGVGLFFLILVSVLIILGNKAKRKAFKLTFYNLSAVFMALVIMETWYFFKKLGDDNSDRKVKHTGTFFDARKASARKAFFGYGPLAHESFTASASRKNDGQVIYNTVYSFEHGRRVTPNNNSRAGKYAVFLGCSFTFGDGLKDNETLPYYFSEFSGNGYNVLNLGFSGYGTHQALKMVEEMVLKNGAIDGDSNIVIYSFIPAHFLRTAGTELWDIYGPWYEVENGKLQYKGSFDDRTLFRSNLFFRRVDITWRSSYLYNYVFAPTLTEKDVTRVVEIIKRMNELLSSKKIKFYVLQGSKERDEKFMERFYSELRNNNIHQFFVDSIIPPNGKSKELYYIKGDGHPNKNYNSEVAKYLLSRIPTMQVK